MSAPDWTRQTLVLIPALNEEACVATTIARWRSLGFARVRVVDNGSADGTAVEARKAGAEVIVEAQRGYGAAAWRGLQDWPSGFDAVLFSSADGSDRLSVDELVVWQHAIDGGADLVVGDRTSGPESRRHLKWIQRFGNQVQCLALAAGWGRRFRDMGSLRWLRRGALDRLRLADRGFGWNLEMQVRAVELKLNCVELPVGYFPRVAGESKISGSLRGTWKAGWGILTLMLQLWRLRRTPLSVQPVETKCSRLAG